MCFLFPFHRCDFDEFFYTMFSNINSTRTQYKGKNNLNIISRVLNRLSPLFQSIKTEFPRFNLPGYINFHRRRNLRMQQLRIIRSEWDLKNRNVPFQGGILPV